MPFLRHPPTLRALAALALGFGSLFAGALELLAQPVPLWSAVRGQRSEVSQKVGFFLTSDLGSLTAVPPPAVAESAAGGPGAVHAVVRLPSHGASATVIDTRPGSTLLLGCAHAFQGPSRSKPLTIDLPCAQPGPARPVRIRLLAVDAGLDLSLVELEDGPLPNVAPVAPAGYRPSAEVLSIGYDGMKWPPQQRTATLLGTQGRTTYTRETPWHGRSGGALLDRQSGFVIGVVQGYEVSGARRGMYVSHATILQFLGRPGAAPSPRPAPAPWGRDLRPGPGWPPRY